MTFRLLRREPSLYQVDQLFDIHEWLVINEIEHQYSGTIVDGLYVIISDPQQQTLFILRWGYLYN